MTEQEMLQKMSDTRNAISRLKSELIKLKKDYISTYAPFPIGAKVRIVGTKDVGILIGYEFQMNILRPIVAKMKKDGTAHATARLFVLSVNNIEQVEI